MKQHTSGHWAIESPDISGAPFRVRKSENHPQGDLTICHVNPYLACESEANAQLIAAAPDLLYALEESRIALTFYRNWMALQTGGRTDYPFGIKTEDKARAAIAKAKGEA